MSLINIKIMFINLIIKLIIEYNGNKHSFSRNLVLILQILGFDMFKYAYLNITERKKITVLLI